MLEEDYLALSRHPEGSRPKVGRPKDLKVPLDSSQPAAVQNDTSAAASQIVREIILPQLEKEVNEGKNFAQLRQVYHSLILGVWYKDKIKESLFGKAYVDQKKTGGVDIEDKAAKDNIWAQYVESFKKGVFNYIKEDSVIARSPKGDEAISTRTTTPRKYFSGGITALELRGKLIRSHDAAMLPQDGRDRDLILKVGLDATEAGASSARAQAKRPQLKVADGIKGLLKRLHPNNEKFREEIITAITEFLTFDNEIRSDVTREIDNLNDAQKIEFARQALQVPEQLPGALTQGMSLEQWLLLDLLKVGRRGSVIHSLHMNLAEFYPALRQGDYLAKSLERRPEQLRKQWKAIYALFWAAELAAQPGGLEAAEEGFIGFFEQSKEADQFRDAILALKILFHGGPLALQDDLLRHCRIVGQGVSIPQYLRVWKAMPGLLSTVNIVFGKRVGLLENMGTGLFDVGLSKEYHVQARERLAKAGILDYSSFVRSSLGDTERDLETLKRDLQQLKVLALDASALFLNQDDRDKFQKGLENSLNAYVERYTPYVNAVYAFIRLARGLPESEVTTIGDLSSWLNAARFDTKVLPSEVVVTGMSGVSNIPLRLSGVSGCSVRVNEDLLKMAIERIVSNGFHEHPELFRTGAIVEVERQNSSGRPRAVIRVLNPGKIPAKLLTPANDAPGAIQSLFQWDLGWNYSENRRQGFGVKFAARAIQMMGGTLSADNVTRGGEPFVKVTISFPTADMAMLGSDHSEVSAGKFLKQSQETLIDQKYGRDRQRMEEIRRHIAQFDQRYGSDRDKVLEWKRQPQGGPSANIKKEHHQAASELGLDLRFKQAGPYTIVAQYYRKDRQPWKWQSTLISIAHGTTPNNERGAFHGSATDHPINSALSPKGIEEVTAGAKEFAAGQYGQMWSQDPDWFVFLRSATKRTKQTADIYQKEFKRRFGKTFDVKVDDDLLEVFFDEAEGMTIEEVQDELGWEAAKLLRQYRAGSVTVKGASMVRIERRVLAWMQRTDRKHPGKIVVIFGHGTHTNAMDIIQGNDRVPIASDGEILWRQHRLERGHAVVIHGGTAKRSDQAQVVGASQKGGIDLTRDQMKLQVKSEGQGVIFKFDPAMIQKLQNASGLTPVIIDIRPMTVSVPEFLGVGGTP